MAEKFIVKKNDKLLNFLFSSLVGWSKKRIKDRLKGSMVGVNGEIITQYDFILNIDDIVEVGIIKKRDNIIKSLDIIYQDKDLIAINKPAGLLSVGSANENKKHALYLLREQLSRGKKRVNLIPVHRLDRDTSGILLFATSKDIRERVMGNWNKATKIYLAIVDGSLKEPKGRINQPLRLDEKEYKVHVGEHKLAKKAITHYKSIKKSKNRTLLEIEIETGRQHQIRAHLSWLGNSIIGDERYGKKGERLGLHSHKLKIYHPIKEEFLSLEVDAPREFYNLI